MMIYGPPRLQLEYVRRVAVCALSLIFLPDGACPADAAMLPRVNILSLDLS